MRTARLSGIGSFAPWILLAVPLWAAEARIPVAEFTAVRMTDPPVLDGRVEVDEWSGR